MFFMIDTIDITSYADDNTPYTKLQKPSVFRWFNENGMIGNQDKCHFLSSLDIRTKFLLTA